MDAREVALLTLNACERQGGWSDTTLKKHIVQAGLDSRDAALATQLCFGVLQNRILCDFYLQKFSNIRLGRMESKVLQALRLGAYQMLLLSRIPHSAAVDRSVSMTRTYCKNPRAAGMVNAILRSLERNLDHLPTIPQTEMGEYLSILYSHPRWLVDLFLDQLGPEETEALLEADNSQPPVTAQRNPLGVSLEELEASLQESGVHTQRHPWLEDCLLLSGTGNLEELPAFQRGDFYIQDPSSRLAVMAADPKPGMRVLDVCAAPGGKSFAMAMAMENRGELLACDLHPHKKKLIEAGAQRLGLSCITAKTIDARSFREEWAEGFDLVLVDAPCSGLGVIRKKPDIRYKDPEPLGALPGIQRDILNNVCRYVRPGGTLVYSTCTLLPQENQDQVTGFLADHPNFHLQSFSLPGPVGESGEGMCTLWPHIHGTDGFFISKLRKEE